VLTANFDEFNRGWTDQMRNRLLICMNEVGERPARPGDMDVQQFCKQYANEDEVTIAQRYHGIGGGPIPNFTNYMGTCNRLRPFRGVDESDRRHCFVGTSSDKAKKLYARRMHDLLEKGDPARVEAMLQAFAYILRSLDVEHDLISRPLDTPLRTLNIAASETDGTIGWLTMTATTAMWAHPAAYWKQNYNSFHPDQERPISDKAMACKMMALSASGQVEQIVSRRGKRNQYRWLVSSERFPKSGQEGRYATDKSRRGTGNVLALLAPKQASGD